MPPVATSAYGTATVNIAADRSVTVTLSVVDMTATAAHIHEGAAGTNGPVIVPLDEDQRQRVRGAGRREADRGAVRELQGRQPVRERAQRQVPGRRGARADRGSMTARTNARARARARCAHVASPRWSNCWACSCSPPRGWFLWDSLKAREAANAAIRPACRAEGLLFLDDTVALDRLRPERDDDGRMRLARVYRFEYSDNGTNRRRGTGRAARRPHPVRGPRPRRRGPRTRRCIDARRLKAPRARGTRAARD